MSRPGMTMTKLIRTFTAVLLAVLLALTVPLQAFAADKEVYISEIVIETGKTPAEAKNKLESAGYTVFDSNISNCENDSDTFGYMYIGYKTTTDPDEAITDMRLMHMGGGYSYSEYEKILQQKRDELDALITRLLIAVDEFRDNYAAGKEAAVTAYGILNQLKEDDTGLLMGDYLLDRSIKKADYTDVFLQCNTAVFITVENALAIACSATREQNIYDLADLDPEDFIGEVQYEDIANDIYNELPYVQTVLSTYADSGLTTADGATEEQITAAFAKLDDEEKYNWSQSFAFAYIVEGIELCDGSTLYDLLMTDPDEITTEDLYPLASVLSDGQAAILQITGLQTVITAAAADSKTWTAAEEFAYKTDEPISIYTGVDRSIFEGGVALTNKAMVEAAVNSEKGWFGTLDPDTDRVFVTIIALSISIFFGAAVLCIPVAGLQALSIGLASFFYHSTLSLALKTALTQGLLHCAHFFISLGCALVPICIVGLGIWFITCAIYLICIGIEYYFPDYDDIPRILVDKISDEDDEAAYIYYYGVKNGKGEVVDINQYDGPRWMSLYTTKDKKAGQPILADLVIQKKNMLNGYTGVRKFSQDAAFNLNNFSYNLYDAVKRDGERLTIEDSYMFFRQSQAEKSNYASVFSGVNTLTAIVSLVLGLALGAAGTAAVTKRKRRENAAGNTQAPAAE